MLSTDQGASGGNTHRTGTVAPLKIYSIGGKTIQIRRLQLPVAIDTQSVKTLLIGGDKKNMGLGHNGFPC
jgi:hypothetical protein